MTSINDFKSGVSNPVIPGLGEVDLDVKTAVAMVTGITLLFGFALPTGQALGNRLQNLIPGTDEIEGAVPEV